MKTWLVIKREYWTRVRKKSFIIITILVPLLMLAFMGIVIGIQMWNKDHKKIAVVDDSNWVAQSLKSSKEVSYTTLSGLNLEDAKSIDSFDAVLHIHPFKVNDTVTFLVYSKEQFGRGVQEQVTSDINEILTNKRFADAGVNTDTIATLKKPTATIKAIDKTGKESQSQLASIIGYVSGILLYMFMFFYGFNVMQSVMEEKTNRIAEIIVSSIKPFQLMLGKIIGVALVGLTQFAVWVVLSLILFSIASGLLAGTGAMTPEMAQDMANNPALSQGNTIDPNTMQAAMAQLASVNWFGIISWFVFYFLGGYFLYASLFAAVGSLVNEDAQESQSLTFPITMPIILGFLILTTAIKNPNGGLAVFGSIFPLTSPIVMMGRIPYGITGDLVWQLALSAVLLVIGFFFTTWIAAKIYRTGILLYGKKVTLKEVGKWLFRKSN